MGDVSAHKRVLKLAAASTILTVAAVATATPTAIHSAEEQALMATLELNSETPVLDGGSIKIADTVETVTVRSPKGDFGRLYPPGYASADQLPSSGLIATFAITDPKGTEAPPLAFEPRRITAGPKQLAYSRFAKRTDEKPAVIVVARLPKSKPEKSKPTSVAALGSPAGEKRVQTSPVLAYAPERGGLDAPFDALMGNAIADVRDTDGDGVFRPRPRPGVVAVENWLDGRSPKQFEPDQHAWVQNPLPENVYDVKQQRCLAEGIYFEARGEAELGQAAVAQVILNRVRAPAYPDTVCDVVYQNKSWRNRCQFSFACDGIANLVLSRAAWRKAVDVAWKVTEGEIWLEDVGDSTHYHANYVRPGWGKSMIKADRIGAHIFYRTRYGGWS